MARKRVATGLTALPYAERTFVLRARSAAYKLSVAAQRLADLAHQANLAIARREAGRAVVLLESAATDDTGENMDELLSEAVYWARVVSRG